MEWQQTCPANPPFGAAMQAKLPRAFPTRLASENLIHMEFYFSQSFVSTVNLARQQFHPYLNVSFGGPEVCDGGDGRSIGGSPVMPLASSSAT